MGERDALILASGSRARRAMLEAAGLAFVVQPADIDEDAVRRRLLGAKPSATAEDVAQTLAAEKALSVSRSAGQALVIGSDQVLGLGAQLFSKAQSIEEAREQLKALRGRTHDLISAVALARGAAVIWQCVDRAQLSMRHFSDEFLDDYLVRAGARVLGSVGCYELEGLGVQLFERVEGDYFTVLGMPLLPLLAQLREEGLALA